VKNSTKSTANHANPPFLLEKNHHLSGFVDEWWMKIHFEMKIPIVHGICDGFHETSPFLDEIHRPLGSSVISLP
jgi:hypothetical protein